MKLRLGLRSRLTVLVTVVFAAAMSITSLFVLRVVEDDLVADTRANAETVLGAYLETIYGGTATVGVVDANDTTRFFYLDGEGNELTDREYFEAIAVGLEADLADALTGEVIDIPIGDLPPNFVTGGVIEGEVITAPSGSLTISAVDPLTGELLDAQGGSVTFIAGPTPVGQPRSVDLGADVVGVAQTLTFTDGTTFDVGVSSPLRPVTDSLDTIRRLLWIAVPVLIAAIAVVTWLAASRALAPVHSVTARARAITAANIGDRFAGARRQRRDPRAGGHMNALLARLEASQQRQHRFVADASHELRSPVAASTVQLEVAAADPLGADWQTTAATVLAEQQHLGRMIDDLLALSRIDEAGARRPEDVDLDDLIGAEVARFALGGRAQRYHRAGSLCAAIVPSSWRGRSETSSTTPPNTPTPKSSSRFAAATE